jgi:ADP-ribosylglycohydrolase
MRHANLSFSILVQTEINALKEEGFNTQEIKKWVNEKLGSDFNPDYENEFWKKVNVLKKHSDDGFEPSKLDQIRILLPASEQRKNKQLNKKDMLDKVTGAWLARCAGCTLGKPVELWPRQKIKEYLTNLDSYPLEFYVPAVIPTPQWVEPWTDYGRTTRGNITKMVRDDDIDYTILGLKILETCGRDFSAEDVGRLWQENFPYYSVFTAEAVAYRNLINDISPSETAYYRNPYREFIGAQIRADMWGYVNPGDPEKAAEMAFRDASLSHTKNGIYGEMWAAACIATAFNEDDPFEIIQAGLDQIPESSRLTKAVKQTIKWAGQLDDWEKVCNLIIEKYGCYDTVHVINNTCMIVMGLLMGKGDFAETLCITMMGGYDTDCTCATVGSILGANIGAESLPPEWITPLNNQVESYVTGFERSNILDLAHRTLHFIDQD